MTSIREQKEELVREILEQDDNEEMVYAWASIYLNSLALKNLKKIYDKKSTGTLSETNGTITKNSCCR